MNKFWFQGYKVLLIEDNNLNREIAQELLEAVGLEVDTQVNGKAAVEAYLSKASGTYLMILMDIDMPIMNGVEATEKIRALPRADAKTIPILAMTGSIFAEDIENAMAAGMSEYISKPIDTAKLYQYIQHYIDKVT